MASTAPSPGPTRPDDPEQPDHDRLAERLHTDDGWGLALDDPHRWAA